MVLAEAHINKRFASNYRDRKFQARQIGSQVRFFEVDLSQDREFYITRETIRWMIQKRRILRAENRKFIKIFKRR